jgi:prepilin-type N-terminal cleavage/methylation domain-containing protein
MHKGMNITGRSAFTLLEVLVVITILAVVAVLAAPSFSDDARLRLMAASTILGSDIELAQVMTISQPENPVVVTFDVSQNRYWLAYASAPEVPTTRADTGDAYLVVIGEGRAAAAIGVTLTTTAITDDILAFNAQGGLEDFTTQPKITLTLNGQWIELAIAPSTGTITETNGP